MKKRALEKAETEVDPTFKARSSKTEPSRVGEGEWGKAPSEALACLLMYSSIFIMISANCQQERRIIIQECVSRPTIFPIPPGSFHSLPTHHLAVPQLGNALDRVPGKI